MLNRVTIAVLILLNGMNAGSQSRYRFRTLDIGQGLTSDFVWSVCQDKYNYIWIGTQNGLNRYDGHNIRQYFNDPKDSFSIPGNSIYWIYKDANEDLWFSLGYKGVARYNYSKDRFERFPLFDSINRKNNHPVWRMGNDGRGRIYFACGSACFRYTKETNVMEDITPLFNGAIEGYGVGMFIPNGKNDLWILTGNGLFHYRLDKNLVTHIPFDKEKMGFGGSEMHDGEFINDHELLLSVVRTGFVLFDTRTGKFRLPPAPFDPTHSGQFSETGGVLKDSKGRIWLANSRYGLLEYFPQKNSSYSLNNEPSYPYPYAEQEGNGMNVYEDNDGNIWYCSSSKGVIWFRPETDFIQLFQRNFAAPNSLPDNLINYFLPVKKNKILVGTNKGVTLFDTESNMFQNYPVAFNDKDIFPHPNVRAMIKSGDTVFITTYKGLSALNTRTGKFRRFLDSDASIEADFPYGQWLIHKISSNELIITGNKAARFYIDSNKYVHGDALNTDPVYTLADINASYFDEKKSTLWVEAGYGKLFSYNTTEKKLEEHIYTSDSISMIDAIVADESGNLWLGTTGGLYNYDPGRRKGHKVVLNTTERSVFNIWLQNHEYIWLATPREIVRYNQRTKKADILNINTFLPNSYITRRAFMLDTAGWLWT
ncbi:MAG TPA: two-component regulator propeller domain-containing protein, partial [Chitinophagaceae bacterium]